MQKIIFILLFSYIYIQCGHAVVEITELPKTPSLKQNIDLIHLFKKQCTTIIKEEINGKTKYNDENWTKIRELTSAEGKKYLGTYVKNNVKAWVLGTQGIAACRNVDVIENLTERVFSKTHFGEHSSNASPQIDILNATEDDQFKFYSNAPYFHEDLMNALEYGGKLSIELDRIRINPLLFLLDPEKIRKYFFKQSHERHNRSENYFKKYYEQWNQDSDRTFEVFLDQFFSTNNFGLPKSLDDRKKYYLTHSVSILNQEVIKNIFNVSNRIFNKLNNKDSIIIFGNSPYYMGRVLKLLNERASSKKINIIELPFSGSPNNVRDTSYMLDNIVTPDRLAHFKERLRKANLMAENFNPLEHQKIYFLDVIGSGGGIGYTIETILCDFKEKQKETLPDFEVISLNRFDLNESRQARITSMPASDGESLELVFPSLATPHFKIPCHVIELQGSYWAKINMDAPLSFRDNYTCRYLLDDHIDRFSFLRVVPKYNPMYWNKEYDYLLTQEHSELIKIMLEYFDTNILDLLTIKETQG